MSAIFKPTRNVPDAWGAYNISAGWVSDIDLYKFASSTSTVQSSLTKSLLNLENEKKSSFRFSSGEEDIDNCEEDLFRNAVFVVQEEGKSLYFASTIRVQ